MAYNPWMLMSKDHSTYKYPDKFRKFFGEHSNNADPMISGFGMVFFTKLPPSLNNPENSNLLTALTTNVTIPDMSLDPIEYEGRDGGKWSVPGAIRIENTLTLNMWELVGVPCHKLISAWVTLMRNPQYGYMTDIDWKQDLYKGKMLYCTCTPDMKVQFAKVYPGIWPLDVKESPFGYEQGQQDKIAFDVQFRFDHYPYTSPEIIASAQAMVTQSLDAVNRTVVSKYDDAAGSLL